MSESLTLSEIVKLLIDMVEPLIVVIMAFWLYRSIPRESVMQVLDAAERNALRTTRTDDEEMVRVARAVATILLNLQDTNKPVVAPVAPETEAQDIKKK